MAARSFDDALSYVHSVKNAFVAQPEKYQEFLQVFADYRFNGADIPNVTARMEAIFKDDHKELLYRFLVYLPPGMIIPPEATRSYAFLYNRIVKEAFHDQPAKYDEFVKLSRDYTSRKLDVDTLIAKMEEVMENNQNLLLGFIVFLPEAQRTISPESEQRVANFLAKLRDSDLLVFDSFRNMLKQFKEGEKPLDDVHEEVVELLEDDDDLVREITHFFSVRPLEIAKYITRLLEL